MWEVTNRHDDAANLNIITFAYRSRVRAAIVIPYDVSKKLTIVYPDKKTGKILKGECSVHKTYTQKIPMWTYRTTYHDDKILYRIYNEIHLSFSFHMFNDGQLKIVRPSKIRRIKEPDQNTEQKPAA